jgi:RHS repeat-associated protein
VSTSYTDAYFWRPASTTDALGNVTSYAYYPTLSVGQVESVMSLNWYTSVMDVLNTPDSYGRPSLQQTRQASNSSNFDTVQYTYDASGRVASLLRPFVSTAGQGASGGMPATAYAYDTLGRYATVSDSTGMQTAYAYNLNDTMVTLTPAPSGENAKTRQFESDALGRVTSVCEVTGTSGAGCGQNNNAGNGYKTSYTYDPLGNLTGVSQAVNLGGYQTRSFAYDGLSRMLSETNPETSSNGNGGTTTYAYDSNSACSGTYNGDKVKRVDPAGNVTCYQWDSLHRLTYVSYVSGPNSANSQNKGFIYDAASVLGLTLSNPLGRLSVAYTCSGTGCSWTGWEAFSYDASGQIIDQYQRTANGNTTYHVQESYFANGATLWLQGFFGTGTTAPFTDQIGSGVDGEGRRFGIWDTNLPNTPIWQWTAYNAASQPTQLSLNSGTESFTYNPNSGRMTQWQSSASTNTQTGSLTWNANGTLNQLVIADNYNSGNAQTCLYGYDDLTRLLSANCGSPWSQTFTYDPFGNITKSGSLSFMPTYGAGNHISSVPGKSILYDGMGNMTADNLGNTYSYDAEGRPVSVNNTVNTITTLFDAFNRPMEIYNGSSYTDIVYAPDGNRFALMNQGTVQKYMVPMVAGLQLVYPSGGGTPYYRHADWLGSSRFAADLTGTMVYDGAYAPFGENYAEKYPQNAAPDRSFTGQTQDVIKGQTGNYDFLFREQSSSQGRWLVPDPAGLAAVDPTNPQTWNRYAYVANNPLNATDPLGLYCGIDDMDGGAIGACIDWDFWIGGGLIGLVSGGGVGPPNRPPSNPPPSPPPVHFPNETLGIPNGLNVNFGGLWGAILPTAICGDLGPCVPIGSDLLGAGLPPVSIFNFNPGFLTFVDLFFRQTTFSQCKCSDMRSSAIYCGFTCTCSGGEEEPSAVWSKVWIRGSCGRWSCPIGLDATRTTTHYIVPGSFDVFTKSFSINPGTCVYPQR